MNITQEKLSKLFTEWLDRYNSNPEEFEALYGESTTYGDVCAAYLIKLDGEIAA